MWHPDLLPFLINLIGLQTLLYPYSDPQALWFVGLIVILYAIYPFLIWRSERPFLRKAIVLLAFIIIHEVFGLVDPRFVVYYFVFLLGLGSPPNSFRLRHPVKSGISAEGRSIDCYPVIVLFCVIFIYALIKKDVGLRTFMVCTSLAVLTQAWIHTTKVINMVNKFWKSLSYASYSIYLFHGGILIIAERISKAHNLGPGVNDLFILAVVLPFIFFFSNYIQRLYDFLSLRWIRPKWIDPNNNKGVA